MSAAERETGGPQSARGLAARRPRSLRARSRARGLTRPEQRDAHVTPRIERTTHLWRRWRRACPSLSWPALAGAGRRPAPAARRGLPACCVRVTPGVLAACLRHELGGVPGESRQCAVCCLFFEPGRARVFADARGASPGSVAGCSVDTGPPIDGAERGLERGAAHAPSAASLFFFARANCVRCRFQWRARRGANAHASDSRPSRRAWRSHTGLGQPFCAAHFSRVQRWRATSSARGSRPATMREGGTRRW